MAARGSEAYRYGSAAPVREPQRAPSPRPQIVHKTKKQIREETRRSRAMAIRLVAAATVLFTLLAFQIYSKVRVDELNRQLAEINTSISNTESDNTRLKMEMESSVSLDKVDKYAQNTLGMVKVEDYQVNYVKLSGNDSVEVSGGKQHTSVWQKLKSAFQ